MTILHRIKSFLSQRRRAAGAGEFKTAPYDAEDRFAVGQVWRYRTRPHEADSRVIIGGIEPVEGSGSVVHVKLVGLKIRNPRAPGEPIGVITHAPVTEVKVRESITGLDRRNGDLTGFQEAYEIWRTAGAGGGAGGVFTIALDQIVACMEEAVEGGSPASGGVATA